MAHKLWFKAKAYGWGWVPCSWEGWAVIAVYILVLVWFMKGIDTSTEVGLYFFIKVFLLTATLLYVSFIKGEKPRWRWGDKN